MRGSVCANVSVSISVSMRVRVSVRPSSPHDTYVLLHSTVQYSANETFDDAAGLLWLVRRR